MSGVKMKMSIDESKTKTFSILQMVINESLKRK